ncbi:aminopeptidase C [Bifidobacterium gallicum DSM 20093 = LMG 11596]|nr:aminopeptidase C [Bifidobacterium gallicum DSM 20093 = LMG 11596]
MSAAYKKAEAQHIAEIAVKANGINASSEREVVSVTDNPFVFSIDVDDEAVSNQQQSGRCWMYSCLNWMRHKVEKDLKLPKGQFQLSQNYNFFFDKLEKANLFMKSIIDCADSDINDRRVTFLMQTPQQDGGDFDPIVALVEKYGVMPLNIMPDTAVTKNTAELNAVLNKMLRQDALALRALVHERASEEKLNEARLTFLNEIYRVLAVSMGEPPEKFDFEYRDKDNNYHVDRNLTPLEFYKKYVGIKLEDYVGVMNLPTEQTPYGKLYTIDMTGEIIGSKRYLHYVNVPMDVFKAAAIEQLKAGEPVWFGCDVTQDADFTKGILSCNLYDYEKMFGIKWTMDKGERFVTYQALPTHAMLIAGVDMDADGKPIRWKIENSWGTEAHNKEVGHQGYFIMDDKWFDEYMFEIGVRKEFLPQEYQQVLETEPEVMPYWSPFNPEP